MVKSNYFLFLFTLNALVGLRVSSPLDHKSTLKCGYNACTHGQSDMLNVHVVPHTHDDVGWLKTVDQYFYGSRQDIVPGTGVQYILDSVILELQKDPSKRFIYVEMAFFSRWWRQQTEKMKHDVKDLVNNGQLQFILGGWCMNDEASTHYNAIIDQHTLGFKFLMENFGDCGRPTIGWQIDPFGHSREQASLFAQFGFDGLFFGRLDYQDKELRSRSKQMEMVWMGSENLGDQSSLFTGVNFNGYNPPPSFCFDIRCKDQPIMDDERLEDFNLNERIDTLIKYIKRQAVSYNSNHIMLTMGSDFHYVSAAMNFKNIDKIIKYVNVRQSNGSKINMFYSTPACYLKSLNELNQTYTSKTDDFFPYADRPHGFWTGYFTSRAALKRYVRYSNNILQIVKQMSVLGKLYTKFDEFIYKFTDAVGIAQHHDAVSGTEKQHVSNDYAKRLSVGINAGEIVIQSVLDKLLPKGQLAAPKFKLCHQINITMCNSSESFDEFAVLIYNPLGRTIAHWMEIPVLNSNFVVMNSNGGLISSQYIPISDETLRIPERKNSSAKGSIHFKVSLPPLGWNTVFVKSSSKTTYGKKIKQNKSLNAYKSMKISNDMFELVFDDLTGLMKSLVLLGDKNETVNFSQNMYYYESIPNNKIQNSGAYIFRPSKQVAMPIAEKAEIYKVEGDLVNEVHQKFSDWCSQVIRLYPGTPYVEVEWTVGPIPISDKIGKEVITRYSTNFENYNIFFTDSNGRENLRRKKDFRPSWNLNQTEPVAGNYFPVNSRIFIQDMSFTNDKQFTVLTDRSQGGSSLNDGDIELMVHRRMLYDDARGVGEAMNETGSDGRGLIVRGKHYLYIGDRKSSSVHQRDVAERIFMAPLSFFSDVNISNYSKKYNVKSSGLNDTELPPNVHLLTLEGWNAKSILLRLEHFYDKSEHEKLSRPVKISLKNLFRTFIIDSVEELILGANMKLEDAKRLIWKVKNSGMTEGNMSSFVKPLDPYNWTVYLKPMQIRTFQLFIK